MTITYRFNVTLTSALTTDPDHPDFYTKEAATAPEHKRRLERALFDTLKKFGADCDCELMDYEIDDTHDAECDCESCQMDRAADTAQETSR